MKIPAITGGISSSERKKDLNGASFLALQIIQKGKGNGEDKEGQGKRNTGFQG